MRHIIPYQVFEKGHMIPYPDFDFVPVGTVKNGYVKTGPTSWEVSKERKDEIDNDIKKEDETRSSRNSSHPGFWHGTPDKSLVGTHGIHVGTYEAAKEALEARIGIPAEGEWDGSREYGKTLLAGKKRLKEIGPFTVTGFNCDAPEENYYVKDAKERPKYSDGKDIPLDSKPVMLHVKITGKMSNAPSNPHEDFRANGMMMRALKAGNARSGFYYKNVGEDEGSISAVVPDKSFLEIIN